MTSTFAGIELPEPNEVEAWHAYKDAVETSGIHRAWALKAIDALWDANHPETFCAARDAIEALYASEDARERARYNSVREQLGLKPLEW